MARQPPKKFIQKNGVNTLNPDYLKWKKKHGTTTSSTAAAVPRPAPIEKMNVDIQVIQGSDLVAKDRNMFGKRVSSDPYVLLSLACSPPTNTPGHQDKSKHYKFELGRTETVKKNLSPAWNYTTRCVIPYTRMSETLKLVFEIFDEDKLSSDDSMGIVTLPALEWKDSAGSTVWCEVAKGSAKHASGKIQVKVQILLDRLQGFKPYC